MNANTAVPWSMHCFFGRVTSVSAEVFVRLRSSHDESGTASVIAGTLTGPRSIHARTLETSVSLSPLPEQEGVWHAAIEDPCFWTPRQPYTYGARLIVQLDDGQSQVFASVFGVPVLCCRERRLELEGRNWTLRAVRSPVPTPADLAAGHESGTTLVVDDPNESLCAEASEQGIQLAADLTTLDLRHVASELRRVARWPAIGFALLPAAANLGATVRQETAHVLRVQHWPSSENSLPADWAQLLLIDRENVEAPLPALHEKMPMIVRTLLDPNRDSMQNGGVPVAAGREACDSLQAELAGRGTFAGYWIG